MWQGYYELKAQICFTINQENQIALLLIQGGWQIALEITIKDKFRRDVSLRDIS